MRVPARARWWRTMRSMVTAHGFVRALRASLCVSLILAASVVGCKDKALEGKGRADAGEIPGGLTPQQAALVVAKAGDHEITLGEFAATIERMDQFDRLRYQTPERRRELLDQMITVELLAEEARKRGLDKDPETAEALRQVLRDAMLKRTRTKLRGPGDIPEPEVRAYYESHKKEFEEPERRRVAHIVVKDKAKAEKLLADAKKANPSQWGELMLDHSVESPGRPYKGALELLGDLGLVGPSGDARGDNAQVPEEVRKAVFEIKAVGEVLDRVVGTSDGQFHIVKMMGKTDAHARTYAEAERTIRISMVQREIQDAEKAMETELRKQFPVQVDEGALAKVKVPDLQPAAAPGGSADPMDEMDHDHGRPGPGPMGGPGAAPGPGRMPVHDHSHDGHGH